DGRSQGREVAEAPALPAGGADHAAAVGKLLPGVAAVTAAAAALLPGRRRGGAGRHVYFSFLVTGKVSEATPPTRLSRERAVAVVVLVRTGAEICVTCVTCVTLLLQVVVLVSTCVKILFAPVCVTAAAPLRHRIVTLRHR